jgi:Holliday junction resolvase
MKKYTEDEIVILLKDKLLNNDWNIISYSLGSEKGIDIIAENNKIKLLIEVKGAKGNPKLNTTKNEKFSLSQFNSNLGRAIIKSIKTKLKYPNDIIAIAYPNDEYFKSHFMDIVSFLENIGIYYFLVDEQKVISNYDYERK